MQAFDWWTLQASATCACVCVTDVQLGYTVGQIGFKWDKFGAFSEHISEHLAQTGTKWDKSGTFSDQISVF